MTKRDLAGDDSGAQLAFLYQEAVRGLAHQQYVVESLNTRAGNLIFATAFATSLLGTRALGNRARALGLDRGRLAAAASASRCRCHCC